VRFLFNCIFKVKVKVKVKVVGVGQHRQDFASPRKLALRSRSCAAATPASRGAYRRAPWESPALYCALSLVGRTCFRGFRYPPQNVAA